MQAWPYIFCSLHLCICWIIFHSSKSSVMLRMTCINHHMFCLFYMLPRELFFAIFCIGMRVRFQTNWCHLEGIFDRQDLQFFVLLRDLQPYILREYHSLYNFYMPYLRLSNLLLFRWILWLSCPEAVCRFWRNLHLFQGWIFCLYIF